MPPLSRHLLLFSALFAFGGGGVAHANDDGPGYHGGDHGPGGRDRSEGPPGGGGPPGSPGADGHGGFFHDHGFFNHHTDPPPTDGDNGAGDDPLPPAVPDTSLATMTLADPDAPAPPPDDDNRGSRARRSRAGLFLKAPILDQEQSRQAIQSGQAVSMPLLLTYLDQKYPGQVLDVKLHSTDEGLVYEVRYLANAVELHTLFLDAMTLNRK